MCLNSESHLVFTQVSEHTEGRLFVQSSSKNAGRTFKLKEAAQEL